VGITIFSVKKTGARDDVPNDEDGRRSDGAGNGSVREGRVSDRGNRYDSDSIAPSRYSLIPILEHLSLAEHGERMPVPCAEGACVQALLEKAKQLGNGTWVVYIGPDLNDKDYLRLDSLKRFRLSLEYLIIDEKALSVDAPVGTRRYQMKETGYDIV
jgi:hypothetical protein